MTKSKMSPHTNNNINAANKFKKEGLAEALVPETEDPMDTEGGE